MTKPHIDTKRLFKSVICVLTAFSAAVLTSHIEVPNVGWIMFLKMVGVICVWLIVLGVMMKIVKL